MREADFDVVVIGAGVVGLACAARLGRERSVLLLERHRQMGTETSSRNSGVIHAGIYYPPGSLKAELCVRGRALLYARCRRDGIGFERCGKLIVATDLAEASNLEGLHERGVENGAGDLELIGQSRLREMEPHIEAVAGIWSPESGIVDVHGLMRSYAREASAGEVTTITSTAVIRLEKRGSHWRIDTADHRGDVASVTANWVINAAGLEADRVATMAGIDIDRAGLRQHYCKGDYFQLTRQHRQNLRHLIYPLPSSAGLGIHLTFDLGGKVTAGPDTEYVSSIRYDIDEHKREQFARAVQRYYPHLQPEDLSPDYSGIRPKLQGPDQPFRDFVIEEASALGAPNLIHLLGIESPGVTASEAIAERVDGLLGAI